MSSKNRARLMLALALVGAGIAGCSRIVDDVDRTAGKLGEEDGGDGGAEDGGEPPAPSCDLSKPFGAASPVPGLDGLDIYSARLSADERTAFLALAGGGGADLAVASRGSTSDPFVIGAPIAELNTAVDEYWPAPSADHEMIFFESSRALAPDDAGVFANDLPRIWSATRPSADAGFGPAVIPGVFRTDGGAEAAPFLHSGGRSLYFASMARGGAGFFDLFVADITDFGVVTGVRPISTANSAVSENMPVVSDDERALFFARPDLGDDDSRRNIWVVGRSKAKGDFGVAQPVVELETPWDEFPSSISRDACRLYFVSNRPVEGVERYRVWVAAKPM
jgi:hypothetical protein